MTSEHTSSPYPPVRRVITGHTPSGKSTFVEDKPVTAHVALEGLDWLFTGLYRHDEFPASNQDPSKSNEDVRFTDVIASKPKELFSRTGTTFWGIDVPPHSKSNFHRTLSVDYGIVTQGTFTLVLDDGERVKLNEGDVVVQRGTIHEWANDGDEWTRAFFVIIPSEKVIVGDKALGMESAESQ